MPNSVQNSVFEVCDTDLKTPAGIYTNQDGYTLRTPSITVGPLIHHPPLPFPRLRTVSLTSRWIPIDPLPSSRADPDGCNSYWIYRLGVHFCGFHYAYVTVLTDTLDFAGAVALDRI